jgi:putative transposase
MNRKKIQRLWREDGCLDKIVGQRGRHPEFIDWCRFGRCGASYIELGSRWENPWVESYGSRIGVVLDPPVGDEDLGLRGVCRTARWPTARRAYRPHSALGILTAVEFADQWRPTTPPKHS